ncbi:unnamed protein product [Symbiodinium natans]|uniref:Uncharacterized protein n=1 Tax=Symbiodinium natans TaxID=878477 RepID=A0A812K6I6_9DINO|nr:unnamed protein product [Symbiodinium natans]
MVWALFQHGWSGFQHGWTKDTNDSVGIDWIDCWVDLKMVTMMVTFFLAFYVNQCFGRYQHICATTQKMFGSAHDFIYHARLFIRKPGKPYDRLCSRWLTAASLLGVAQLESRAQTDLDEQQWKSFVASGLVRKTEVEFLRGLGGLGRLLVLTQMAGEVVRAGLEAEGKADSTTDTVMTEMVDRLLVYKEHHQDLLDLSGVQVPLHYQHLVTVMVFGNLLFLSYGMALTKSWLAPCMFLLISIILIGMMDVSARLWNPFGAESTGFALQMWAGEFLAGARAILDYEHDGAKEGWAHELQEEHYANINLQKAPEEVQHLFDGVGEAPEQVSVHAEPAPEADAP